MHSKQAKVKKGRAEFIKHCLMVGTFVAIFKFSRLGMVNKLLFACGKFT